MKTFTKGDQANIELIIGDHPKMARILMLIEQVADSDTSILIQGESGTGKELIARSLHYNSARKDKPFIPINCGALPENLLESELFGHVTGSFTGAIKDKIGWFMRAQKGTIFLDEVSEMPPTLQVKLLRVLQSGEFSQVGGTEILYSNVRIITATNQNLYILVKKGKFREDLYYRLNVIHIELPPLRDRKTDIPQLVQHFLKIHNSKSGLKKKYLSPKAESLLLNYNYPGNIRELENAIQRAIILVEGNIIQPKHLPEIVCESQEGKNSQKKVENHSQNSTAEKAEQEFIIFCLENTQGHISKAAEKAGINVSNFYKTMKKYSIDPRDFKQ